MPIAKALWDQHLDRLSKELGSGVAEELFGLSVHESDASVPAHDDHGIGCGLEQATELCLGFLAYRDVANGARDKRAPFGLQGAQADLDGEFRAVFAQTVQFQPRAHRTNARVGEERRPMRGMVAAKSLRDEDLHPLPDELITVVAKELLSLRVHQLNTAVASHDHYCIGRRLHQVAELCLGFLALGDVANGARHERSLFGFERTQTDLDRKLASVLAIAVEFEPRPHRSNLRVGEKPSPMFGVLPAKALGDQLLDRLTQKLLARIAE